MMYLELPRNFNMHGDIYEVIEKYINALKKRNIINWGWVVEHTDGTFTLIGEVDKGQTISVNFDADEIRKEYITYL